MPPTNGVHTFKSLCPICGQYALEVRLESVGPAQITLQYLKDAHERTELHKLLKHLAQVRWEATHWVERAA